MNPEPKTKCEAWVLREAKRSVRWSNSWKCQAVALGIACSGLVVGVLCAIATCGSERLVPWLAAGVVLLFLIISALIVLIWFERRIFLGIVERINAAQGHGDS